LKLGNPNGGLKDIYKCFTSSKFFFGKKQILYFLSNSKGLCELYIGKDFGQPLENGFTCVPGQLPACPHHWEFRA